VGIFFKAKDRCPELTSFSSAAIESLYVVIFEETSPAGFPKILDFNGCPRLTALNTDTGAVYAISMEFANSPEILLNLLPSVSKAAVPSLIAFATSAVDSSPKAPARGGAGDVKRVTAEDISEAIANSFELFLDASPSAFALLVN
jgi:hypothetical protein